MLNIQGPETQSRSLTHTYLVSPACRRGDGGWVKGRQTAEKERKDVGGGGNRRRAKVIYLGQPQTWILNNSVRVQRATTLLVQASAPQ